MKKASKYKSKYVIGRSFYSHLAFYIVITIFILTVLAFAITSFAYFLGIPLGDFPEDACIAESENFNVFYCLVIHGKDSRFYDLLYYFFIILIIVSILALIILNVIYIVNRFYFVRLVKEKSCGAVIYKVENGKVYYLLLKMNYGHTSLCKGHQEEGESDEETAIREIKEETSLDVKLDTSFNDSSLTPKDDHDEEVASFEWCDYEEALFKITYDSDRNVVKKAEAHIKRYRGLE